MLYTHSDSTHFALRIPTRLDSDARPPIKEKTIRRDSQRNVDVTDMIVLTSRLTELGSGARGEMGGALTGAHRCTVGCVTSCSLKAFDATIIDIFDINREREP